VGLVARFLEEKGISTVILTPTPEFHREIGFPRTVALEYPYGRALGQVNDVGGQRQVLMATLDSFSNATEPGTIEHLNFEWPEEAKDAKWHPPEISPIVKLFLGEIKKQGEKGREK
jgi:hypothetical protein